jgi:hypothetical protein
MDDSRGMRIGAGRCVVTGWWTGRAGGRDADGRPAAAVRAAVAGLSGRPRPSLSARRARRGASAAAGAGPWMRSSPAPGPTRSGCGTRRAAASGWCAAPTPPIRRRRGWWRSRRTPEDRAGRDLGRARHRMGPCRAAGSARRPRPRRARPFCCNAASRCPVAEQPYSSDLSRADEVAGAAERSLPTVARQEALEPR